MSQKGLKVRDVPSHGSSVEPVTLSNAFGIVLGVHIVFALSSVILLQFTGEGAALGAGELLLAALPFWLAIAVAFRWVTNRTRVEPFEDGRVKGRGLVIDVVGGAALGAVAQALVLPVLYLPINKLFGVNPSDVERPARLLIERSTGAVGVIALVVATCVAAPCFEELLYRGILLPAWRMQGTARAVLGSSAVFAAMHLQLIQFPGLFLFGTLAAVLAVKRGLVASIAAHVGFNLTTLLLLGLIN